MAGFKEYQMLFQLNASVGGGFNSAFASGQNAVQKLQGEINSLNKTQADIQSYQKQQSAIDKTKAKIELYQKQLINLQNAEASTSKEEAELANAIAAKEKQLNDSNDKLAQQNAALSETGEALRAAGVDTNNFASETARLEAETAALQKAQMEEAESTNVLSDALAGAAAAMEAIGAAKALEKVYNVLKDCSAEAAAFETSMASVKRTVGGDDAFIGELGETFKELSTQMPIAASELAEIAATAGQLGIAQDNVEGFTEVMAQLATTTDLTADNAATMLAQFANITGTTEYDRLGATVAALGDSTATTASKVVEMSQGMAAAANIAGMSETDILAISAAVGSLGIESQAGSTAMSQLITTLYKATETGEDLESFASVAGMTASEFSSAWAGDPVNALNSFIQGLNNTERNGRSAMVVLDELGINNVRQTKAILGLASAGDLLSNTIAQANSAWSENSALTEKAGIMYNTTEARMTMMQNAANNISIAVGDALNPALAAGADLLTGLLQPIAEFISENPALVQGITAFVGVLGIATVGLTAYTAKAKLAAAASALLGTSMPALGTILAVAGGIGALVTTIGLLTSAGKDTGASFEELKAEFEELSDSIEENQNIIDLVEQYQKLSKEVKAIGELDPEDIQLKATIENSGVTQENLELIDELKSRITNETGELTQILQISGAENVTQENLDAIVNLAANTADGDHDLEQQLALIGAENISDDDMKRLKELAKSIKDDEATLTQNLKLTGFESYADMKKAAELPISSKTANIIVNLKEEGYENVSQKLSDIGAQVVATQNELDTAKGTLSEMQENAVKLQETIDATKNKKKKGELEEELKGVNDQIKAQEQVITTLEDTHSDLVTQYEATSAAAQELKDKEDALAATKAQLAEATGGVIAGSEEETEALYAQAAATAEVDNALKLSQLYGNLDQQARKYTQAIIDATGAETNYKNVLAMVNASHQFAGKSAEEINQHYQNLLQTLDQMQGAEGFDPSNIDYQNTIDQVEALSNIFRGYSEDLNQYAADTISWVDSFSDLGTNEAHWSMMLQEMNASVVEYKKSLDDATGTQNEFLNEIAEKVLSGVVPIEEVKRRLTEAWKDEENQAELVAGVVDYVNAQLEAQAEAAEAAAAANEELANSGQIVAQSSSNESRAIEDIIQEIDALQKAYDDAYKAAYDSMGGQFKLFDQAKDIKPSKDLNKDLNSYKAGLESQKKYMEDYADNYKAVAEAVEGVNPDVSSSFMAELADGSAESAQVLANLAEAAPEDVAKIVQAYAEAQAARDSYAQSVADAQTDFSNKMTALQAELTSTVQAMDFSAGAAANARASLEAFVNQAAQYEGRVYMAYKRIAQKAQEALRFNPTPGYASGTDSAERGVHLVGEEGPELVYFKGGETVMNAQKTQEVLTRSEPISAMPANGRTETSPEAGSPTYNINVTIPSINAEGMKPNDLIKAIARDLKGTIVNTMKEYDEDRKRRTFS